MSLLLQHLAPVANLLVKSDPNDPTPMDASGVPKMLGPLFALINEGSAVDALERVFPDFNSRWLEFSFRWMNGSIYSPSKNPVPSLNNIATLWRAKILAADGPWSLTLPKGDKYIGALHEVRLDNMTFPSKGQLKFTLTSTYNVKGEMTADRSRVIQVQMTETGKSVCREKTTAVTTSVTAGPLLPTRSFVWTEKPAAEYSFEGLFPSGFQAFEQRVQITYVSEFVPPESYHFTSASGGIKLKFLEK